MTTPADDTAVEDAFEAYLAGRPVTEEAAGLAVFAEAVRATATQPGRPNAALAELLATGLLADQSSPSARTARSAGAPPSRRASRTRNRRRFAMILPALLAKLLSAGAVAQAATGAGVVIVVATGAGATGVLGDDVQDTIVGVVASDEQTATDDASDITTDTTTETVTDETTTDTTADAGDVEGTQGEESLPVEVEEELDPEAWVEAGPEGYASFGAWVSKSAHNPELREWLRAEGKTFGSMVREWASKKGVTEEELAEEGVDLGALTDETGSVPVTEEPAEGEEPTEVAETEDQDGDRGGRGNGNGGGNGGGNGNGNGNGKAKGNGRN
jgi:hypothetical protein